MPGGSPARTLHRRGGHVLILVAVRSGPSRARSEAGGNEHLRAWWRPCEYLFEPGRGDLQMPPEILRVISGPAEGSTIELNGELAFGRAAGDGGTLGGDPQLSRKHARISRANGGLQIEDLGSTNGTYVNGERVTAPRPIKAGDKIELGDTTLEVGEGERLTTVAPVVDTRDENGEAPTSINAVLPPTGPPVEPVGATGTPAGAATPGTRSPVRPPARVGDARHPAAGRGGPSRAVALLTALVGLLIGAGIVGIIWAADGSASDSGVEKFSLMAEGFSTEVLDPKSQQREITITMRTFEAPHDIQQLRVHKFLDETRPPPQRTYDAIYTFTARNG